MTRAVVTIFAALTLCAVCQAEQTPEAMRAQIEAMRAKDVAWRNIKWKTCLIDGLGQSGAEQKPVILWVFIDRPVDDERC